MTHWICWPHVPSPFGHVSHTAWLHDASPQDSHRGGGDGGGDGEGGGGEGDGGGGGEGDGGGGGGDGAGLAAGAPASQYVTTLPRLAFQSLAPSIWRAAPHEPQLGTRLVPEPETMVQLVPALQPPVQEAPK